MPEQDDDRHYPRWLDHLHARLCEFYDRSRAEAQRINARYDSMITWYVSLATGGILLAFQIPERFTGAIPASVLLMVQFPWALAIVVGVLGRIYMDRLETRDAEVSHKKAWELRLVVLRKETDEQVCERMLSAIEHEDPESRALADRSKGVGQATMALFLVGGIALFTALVANVVLVHDSAPPPVDSPSSQAPPDSAAPPFLP